MKSSSYYSRRAADMREVGRWYDADFYAKMAAKARRCEKQRKAREALVAAGRKGGSSTSEAKAAAARTNGRMGGRPKKNGVTP